jgi:hypothetical protein
MTGTARQAATVQMPDLNGRGLAEASAALREICASLHITPCDFHQYGAQRVQ